MNVCRREHPGGSFLYNFKFCISSIGAEAMIRVLAHSLSLSICLFVDPFVCPSVIRPFMSVRLSRPSAFQFLQSFSGKRPWLTRHQDWRLVPWSSRNPGCPGRWQSGLCRVTVGSLSCVVVVRSQRFRRHVGRGQWCSVFVWVHNPKRASAPCRP